LTDGLQAAGFLVLLATAVFISLAAQIQTKKTIAANHTWKFSRAGGFDQVKLESAADLANLDQLDQKLWVALACPARGLEFDNRTLDLIDTDKDGRVLAPDVIAAAKWATSLLKKPDDLLKGSPSLPLASINDAEARLNQNIANLLELQVRKANISAERHHQRSGKFFFGMLAAQAAVIVSTLAMAARQRNLLWILAAATGLAAIAFAIYVYLCV
jgi:hypothetical protein